MKVAVVLGTRPEIIKMAPIIYELKKRKISHYIIHSGQHYSFNMDKVFFEQLQLSRPKYKLEVGSSNPGMQTGKIIEKIEKVLLKERPDVVLIQGDTNTVLGGAIAAKKLDITIGHIEAGLRSFDNTMPEETNRILADHCSNFLFTPSKISQNNLLKEGIDMKKIFVTGNTIVDSVKKNIKKNHSDLLEKYNIESKKFFLVSLHRQENVDNPKKFTNIIKALKQIRKKYNIQIIYPIHPRSSKMAKKFKINLDGLLVVEPINYFSFLYLEKNARLVLTDSGGVQEESCILKTPCVTLRDNTERPETVTVKSNVIVGTDFRKISLGVEKMLKTGNAWKNPFGDGTTAKKIIDILQKSQF